MRRSPHAQSGVNAHKTHCSNGHKYTPENTYNYRKARLCKTCKAVWQKIRVKNGYHKEYERKKRLRLANRLA